MNDRSDNAVLAKVRVQYGRRLIREDYERLLACKSVGEVAGTLKTIPGYAERLTEVREDLIHRGQLESLIRRRTMDMYAVLFRYTHDEMFYRKLYFAENEVNQLLLGLRLLNAGTMDRYIVELPAWLARHMSFDLFALAKAKTFDDFLGIVSLSPYYPVLLRFRPVTSKGTIDITGCERALLEHNYQSLLRQVEREYKGETAKELTQLLYHRIDFHNISVLYRLLTYPGYPRDKIKDALIAIRTGIRRSLYEEITAAPDRAAVVAGMKKLRLLRAEEFSENDPPGTVPERLDHARQKLLRSMFRFTGKPVVGVICYMLLLELEIGNLIHIIEGIRYQVPADAIRSLLVY